MKRTKTCRDAYERGFERGRRIASWVDLPDVGDVIHTDSDGKVTVTEENQWEVVQSLAWMSESSDRDFSPFEFTASEFNKARNSEARWDAFEEGINDGISTNVRQRQLASHYRRICSQFE